MFRHYQSSRCWTTLLVAVALSGCRAMSDAIGINPPVNTDWSQTDWEAPVNLGPLINTASNEGQLGIAPNGRSLYVGTNKPGGVGDADIWVSLRQPDGTWGPLVNLGPTVNSSALEASPTLSIDGHYLYLASRRPGGVGGLDCWRSHRDDVSDDFAWSAPVNLGPPVNSTFDDADCLPVGNQDGGGSFWFTSLNRPGGVGGYDIWKSEIAPDGSFGAPSNVVELNTAGRDTRLTLTGNGKTIFFTSIRAGGLGGIDIWMAQRPTTHDPFCSPVNLGPLVNSSADDRSPSITTNGHELFFTSTRPGGFGGDDVYMAAHIGGQGPNDCN